MDEDEDDELERVAGVLAILEQAGVIILLDGSGEPGRDTALVAGEPDDTDPPLPGPRRERVGTRRGGCPTCHHVRA